MEIPDTVQFVYCTVDTDELFLDSSAGNYATGTVFARINRIAAINKTTLDTQVFVGSTGR